MNCNRMKEKIYLYNELTSSERKALDEHLNQCDECSTLARQLVYSQRLIKEATRHKPEMTNPNLLTQRIMMAIETEKSRPLFAFIIDYLDSLFLRYAISAVSVFLISFFVYEQRADDFSSSVSRTARSDIRKGAVLDYGNFRNMYVRQKENRSTAMVSSRYSYYKSEQVGKK